MRSKLSKSKFDQRNFSRKWFWSHISWVLQNSIFQFFENVWMTKLKTFSEKLRQRVQNCLTHSLVKGRFLKTNVLRFWEGHFSVFCKFLSVEVETIFWKREAMRSTLFRLKSGHRKLLRKEFWSYLEFKNKFSERWKRAFFSFLQILEWLNWNRFLESTVKRF